ncbi:pentatricopeptide repeat-containing protein At1g80270, mitochondrial [Arachis ipaensis]|uniref:pentatricopeptide repeat-containing protein At1g80270, mitochondrial n=1 Tax=Arachis ipaensis TaxID=130454 RepID=UPI0007AF4349|nr:pentatricopeptide repeat-containing protein At1g80270, mitochondrial [Arachis ipaensis]QHN84606.1 Pentatricopeptide repeat-containing protein [Arachis hypogaea]
MWALRRASLPLRNRGFNVRASCIKSVSGTRVEDDSSTLDSSRMAYGRFLLPNMFYHSGHASLKFTVSRRELSSQADASSTKDQDDLEDGFSELETPAADSEYGKDEFNDIKDGEEPREELEFSDTEVEPSEKKVRRRAQSEIFKLIDSSPTTSVHVLMDKWVEEGKELSRQDIALAMVNLRRRKLYFKAFQLSEWVVSKSQLEVTERDHATRVDLIAKLRGLHEAEMYIERIPESFKGETVYQTLLASCVAQNNLKKAEETFNKMKDLKFPLTSFVWNQLLLLYKRHDKKKIADVLLMMENENVKPSPFTYKILIDAKGQSKDIDGMDLIVEKMKAQGIEPDIRTKAVLVGHYKTAGLEKKAEDMLKEMEGENLEENSWLGRYLLPLYANLGKADEVGRIWEVCQASPRIEDCLAAIEAFGKLKKIDEAEAVFEMISKRWKLSSKNYSVMLKVYANNKMLAKGKDLIKRMAESGCQIGPLTLDDLVKLHIQAGEVEKADTILQKAIMQSQLKPLIISYIAIMEQYAKRGDVHNSEKILHKIKQAGYTIRLRQYQILVQAYINAKLPAYRIRDSMKADNVFPNRDFANLLAQVDGFRKNPASDLLD